MENLIKSQYNRHYLSIAMPAAIESTFMVLLASADLIMVGSLGAAAIAAVNIFGQPRLVLLTAARSISNAVTLLTARRAGAGDIDGISSVLKKTLLTGGTILAILHVLFFLGLQQVILLMGARPDYYEMAMNYGTVATVSVFITSMTLLLQAAQLGKGETAAIMKTNVIGNIINVVSNALLIFGLGPFPKMGVTGAAIGTVVGASFTLLATIYIMWYEKYFSRGGTMFPDKTYFKEIVPVIGSLFAEMGAERVGMVLFTRMATSLGTVPFAVHSICMNLADIHYCFSQGLGKASMVLAGQSCGAKNEREWKRYKCVGITWSTVFSAIFFSTLLFFRKEIFHLYSADPETLAMGSFIVLFVAVVCFPESQALVCAGILRGSGKTSAVAAYSFISITVFRPLVTAFLIYKLGWGLTGAWTALLLDQATRAGCATYLMQKIKKIA